MRFPTASILLALPALAAAAEEAQPAAAAAGPFDQYKAQFQNFLGSVNSYLQAPAAPAADPVAEPAGTTTAAAGSADSAAAAAKANGAASGTASARGTALLTLDNWKDTLYRPVPADATTPTEWWLLVTGGNKTCFGHCQKIDAAFLEASSKLSSVPDGPNTAILNCELQPVLCNSWSASPSYLYVFELLPEPAKTDIYTKRLNLTTTTADTILDLYNSDSKESFTLLDSYFHPLDGPLATNGVAVPIGYVLWFFNVIPSWVFMVSVSFLSRTFMGRRMAPPGGARPAGPVGGFPRAQ